ncbi:hypothetical protein PNI0009_01260 [Streptococcus pneumoniae PNI0009]|nr:hypothetical protein PCS81218_00658 [Streptococcus pneumoniae PCS81218]ELU80589.1 hypothetical protein PNI0009_01260 [Streptococcus pneumoniae PNI0009]
MDGKSCLLEDRLCDIAAQTTVAADDVGLFFVQFISFLLDTLSVFDTIVQN